MKEITSKVEGTYERVPDGLVSWELRQSAGPFLIRPLNHLHGWSAHISKRPWLLEPRFGLLATLHVGTTDFEVVSESYRLVRIKGTEWFARAPSTIFPTTNDDFTVYEGSNVLGVIKSRYPSGRKLVSPDGSVIFQAHNAWKDSDAAESIVWHTYFSKDFLTHPGAPMLLALILGVWCLGYYHYQTEEGPHTPFTT